MGIVTILTRTSLTSTALKTWGSSMERPLLAIGMGALAVAALAVASNTTSVATAGSAYDYVATVPSDDVAEIYAEESVVQRLLQEFHRAITYGPGGTESRD